jgi:hypothetical protein
MNKRMHSLFFSAWVLCLCLPAIGQSPNYKEGSHIAPDDGTQWIQLKAVQNYLEQRAIEPMHVFRQGLLPSQGNVSCYLPAEDVIMALVDHGSQVLIDMTDYIGTFDVAWMDPARGDLLMEGSVPTVEGGQMADLGLPPPTTNVKDWVVIVDQGRGIPQIIDLDIIPSGCETANLTTRLYNNGQIVQIDIQQSLDGEEFQTVETASPSASLGQLREMWSVATQYRWQAYRIRVHWQNGVLTSRTIRYELPCTAADVHYGMPTFSKRVKDQNPEGN